MAENKDKNTYADTHSKIKSFRYIIVVLLVIFVILALFFYREDLTVENLKYLAKYVDVKPVTFGSDDNTQINFESDSGTVTDSFKEDLVVLTKSSLKIYDLTSKEILDVSHSIVSPALAMGEKYFAVYDMGARYVAIYNSFARLKELTFDYPVYDVALDSKGNFCVATGEKDHTSALKVYNSDFENIFNWKSVDKYSLTADIYTDEKSYMAVGTLKSTEQGDLLSGLTVFSADSDKVLAALDFESEMIMQVSFNADGRIVCLTDRAVRLVSLEGEILSEHSFNSKALRKFETSGKWTALLLNDNLVGKTHRMIIFDSNGNTYMETSVDSEITDMRISNSYAFLLGVEDITVADIKEKTTRVYDCERSYRSLELIDEKNVYLVYDGLALALGVE